SNRPVIGFKIGLGTFHDFFGREGIDWIERSHIYAELVSLSAKRTDPARYIQHSFSNQLVRFKQEVAAILFECATEQHNPIKLKPTFALHQIIDAQDLYCVCVKRRWFYLVGAIDLNRPGRSGERPLPLSETSDQNRVSTPLL